MYHRCLFCAAALGANDAIEEMPIGGRLAFDSGRGRLWVICRQCARWNLTPIDDRWEAIEACERRFQETRVRISTSNIGLAQLPSGLELVRIGRPVPTEFAAWRYGRQFLRRQRRKPLLTAGKAAMVGVAPALAVLVGPGAALACSGLAAAAALGLLRMPAAVVPTGEEGRGDELRINLNHVRHAELIGDEHAPDGWALVVDHLPDPEQRVTTVLRAPRGRAPVKLTGLDARLAAATLLPRLNPVGGDADTVENAVQWLEASGGPGRAFAVIARSPHVRPALIAHHLSLASLHDGVRLALEMSVHEDEERRHLEGELSVLAWMWRREENLAEIADSLGLPERLEAHLERLRVRS